MKNINESVENITPDTPTNVDKKIIDNCDAGDVIVVANDFEKENTNISEGFSPPNTLLKPILLH